RGFRSVKYPAPPGTLPLRDPHCRTSGEPAAELRASRHVSGPAFRDETAVRLAGPVPSDGERTKRAIARVVSTSDIRLGFVVSDVNNNRRFQCKRPPIPHVCEIGGRSASARLPYGQQSHSTRYDRE